MMVRPVKIAFRQLRPGDEVMLLVLLDRGEASPECVELLLKLDGGAPAAEEERPVQVRVRERPRARRFWSEPGAEPEQPARRSRRLGRPPVFCLVSRQGGAAPLRIEKG